MKKVYEEAAIDHFFYDKWKKLPKYYELQNKIRDMIFMCEECISDESMDETMDVLSSGGDVDKWIEFYTLMARNLASRLPYTDTLRLCMGIYGKVVNGEFQYWYEKRKLHLCALHALEVLDPLNEQDNFNDEIFLKLLLAISSLLDLQSLKDAMEAGLIGQNVSEELTGYYVRYTDERTIKRLKEIEKGTPGKGKRLRFRIEPMDILNPQKNGSDRSVEEFEIIKGIDEILNSGKCGNDVAAFENSYFRLLPGRSQTDASYRDFLMELRARLVFAATLMLGLKKQAMRLSAKLKISADEILAEFFRLPSRVSNKALTESMIFSPTGKFEMSKTDTGTISSTFIMRTKGSGKRNCYTSVVCCMDALNAWLEASIYDAKSMWAKIVRENLQTEFEKEVNQFFTDNGYESGNLEQDGKWNTKNKVVKIKEKVSGEIDVLAVNSSEKIIYIIECKRYDDFLVASENLYKKIKSVSKKICGTHAPKHYKKRVELSNYLNNTYPGCQVYTALVTDISFPVYRYDENRQPWEAEVAICNFEELKQAVQEKRKPDTRLAHLA